MTTEFIATVQSGGPNTLRVHIPRAVCQYLHLKKGELLRVRIDRPELHSEDAQILQEILAEDEGSTK